MLVLDIVRKSFMNQQPIPDQNTVIIKVEIPQHNINEATNTADESVNMQCCKNYTCLNKCKPIECECECFNCFDSMLCMAGLICIIFMIPVLIVSLIIVYN